MLRPATVDALHAAVTTPRGAGVIARGMGRSYGDAAQRRGGLVIDTTALRQFDLDAEAGTVTALAGATLAQLLAALQPAGWVLPVVPGTQHVSVGGAIASDIHGKNHGTVGTFGSHVLALGLLTASGEVIELAPDHELMAATIGGMGLTGVILWAQIKLRRLGSATLSVDTDRAQSLEEIFSLLDGPGGSHRVAWVDLLSRRLARGVVTRAEQLIKDPPARRRPASTTVPARLNVPAHWPGGLLRTPAVQAFNEWRFRRTPRRQVGHVESFGAHMFPLDGLDNWFRLYGATGFVQYQFVVPRGQEPALEAVVKRLRRSPIPCYLAVLKDFGVENHAPLSFPMAGWTLTLDLPRRAPDLERLLRDFDELVAGAGGRVYLAKDGRLRPDALAAMYPRLEQWRAIRDQADPERRWRSDLGLRTGLVSE
ncbi:MAG: decaprenylphospho-beta-D-ribofuranose 2-oxidase [Solirubrobacteraceae bacterium]|jgi:decaprenylphospho-beta-D-ribofuranose 2-oxidase|nr:decaprenylphospho-beta-D-ribofuranose 2-oxidase [Solirubrobacteraceae bacterium]